jgi:2-C-methyl-D-erythritol 2,4-cyclodiphosphate synthase
MNFRTGMGYDVHRLAPGEELWLGGIQLDYPLGCVAHSDGDVLIHAICDALLGAVGERDIGHHFPDTDKSFKNIDSKLLLAKTMETIRSKGYEISNVDTVLCLQKPKIGSLIPGMQQTLAKVMAIQEDQVNIKATTTEKLGFVGEEKGIAAYATCLVYKIEKNKPF